MCIWDKTEICHFVHIILRIILFHSCTFIHFFSCLKLYSHAYQILPRVHDLFLISFSDGNSPNRAVSSCQNTITLEAIQDCTQS